jgi:hypothetical protein
MKMYWDVNTTVIHSVLKLNGLYGDWRMGITGMRGRVIYHKLHQKEGYILG